MYLRMIASLRPQPPAERAESERYRNALAREELRRFKAEAKSGCLKMQASLPPHCEASSPLRNVVWSPAASNQSSPSRPARTAITLNMGRETVRPETYLEEFLDDERDGDWRQGSPARRARSSAASQRRNQRLEARESRRRNEGVEEDVTEEEEEEVEPEETGSDKSASEDEAGPRYDLPPEEYKPSSWICQEAQTATMYVPQVGDEVIYLREGHEQFLEDAIKQGHEFVLPADLPDGLGFAARCRLAELSYRIGPPSLAIVTLQLLDEAWGGKTFTFEYHDVGRSRFVTVDLQAHRSLRATLQH